MKTSYMSFILEAKIIMKITICFFGIMLATLLISCGHDIDPEEILTKEIEFKFKLNIHSKPNNSFDTLTTKTIQSNSEKIIKLKEWLTGNPDGWISSIASWATPSISLTGKDFKLIIYENGIVIGFKDKKGKLRQYSKPITKKELDFLSENK